MRLGGDLRGGDRRGARRLGRCCEATARDLFVVRREPECHLKASSSRKYVMVMPRGLMGMSSFGTCDLKTKTKFAV